MFQILSEALVVKFSTLLEYGTMQIIAIYESVVILI